MKIYHVYQHKTQSGEYKVIRPNSWSFGAFFFGFLWLLYKKAYSIAFMWFIFQFFVCIFLNSISSDVSRGFAYIMFIVLSDVFWGLKGMSFVEKTYQKKYKFVGAIDANDSINAILKYKESKKDITA